MEKVKDVTFVHFLWCRPPTRCDNRKLNKWENKLGENKINLFHWNRCKQSLNLIILSLCVYLVTFMLNWPLSYSGCLIHYLWGILRVVKSSFPHNWLWCHLGSLNDGFNMIWIPSALCVLKILFHCVNTPSQVPQWANLHHLDIKMTTDPMSINCLFLIWFESSNDIIFTTSK